MKHFYTFKIFLLLVFLAQMSWGQIKLGNNPASIDPAALLELDSSTQGLLLPRMTSAQRDALPMDSSPVGLLIYNTDINEIQYLYETTVTNAKGEKRQELRWESATDDTIPLSRPTNPVTGQLFYDVDMGQLNLWDGSQWVAVGSSSASSGGTTSTISYQTLTLTGTQLSISNGNTVDLSSLVTSTTGPTGPQGPQGPAGPQGNPATDDQTLTVSALSANNTLTIAISGGNTETLDLSSLATTGVGTQSIAELAFDSKTNSLTVGITNGASQTVDLSNLNQDIAELAFDSTTNSLTVGITDGVSQTIELTALAPTGLVSVTEGGNTGYRLALEPEANHGDIGNQAVDLSIQTATSTETGARGQYAFAAGRNTTASGNYAFATGENAIASGNYSFAAGRATVASGTYSIALGNDTEASGFASMAWGGTSSTASGSYSTSWGAGRAYGDWSTAFGRTTYALGNSSYARGLNNTASGNYSSVWGISSTAPGSTSTAWGWTATASGSTSTAGGVFTTAESYGQTSFGLYNTPHPGTASSTGYVASDRLLVVGNGTSTSTRADALVILKDGTTTLNGALTINVSSTTSSYTLPVTGGSNGQVLSMLDATTGTTTWTNIASAITGLVSVTEGGNTGHRLATSNVANHGDIGDAAVDLSTQTAVTTLTGARGDYSFAVGRNTTAAGNHSTAWGFDTDATGNNATAWGQGTEATGVYATAWGQGTEATGVYATAWGGDTEATGFYATAWGFNTDATANYATAWGESTTASGTHSTAFGRETTAESYLQTTIGTYNTTQTGNANSFAAGDRLLVVGNGTNNTNRSDALVILKDGTTTLNGALTINTSSTTASYTLPVSGGSNGQVLSMLDANSGTTTWTSISGGGVFTSNTNTLFSSIGTTTHDFIIGSDQIDNITGGEDDARMYFDKSKAAFRAGHASGTTWNDANVGDHSAAFGFNTEASGDRSTAFGNATEALSYAETAMGSYNTTTTPLSKTSWNTNDRLFVIGNGNSSANRSDALIILKDGTTTLNGAFTINTTSTTASYTLPVGGGSNGQVLSMLDVTTGTTTWTNIASAITGLVSVTEGSTAGHRLATASANNHGDIGAGAIDLSTQTAVSTTTGARGNYSFAAGENTTASGTHSFVAGRNSTATGDESVAIGRFTTASGDNSVALGQDVEASGRNSVALGRVATASASFSTALGNATIAESYGETALGSYNTTVTVNSATSWDANDRLLVVGKGTNNTNRSDALVILKDGTTTLNGALTINTTSTTASYTLPVGGGSNGQVLSMLDANSGTTTWTTVAGGASTGLASVTEGSNSGYRLALEPEANHGDIGNQAVDLSIQTTTSTTTGARGDYSTAMGRNSTASGNFSTAMGRSTASGVYSVAIGENNTASGDNSTAMGRSNVASGNFSTAMGHQSTASGYISTAMGRSTASGFYSTAIGENNTASGIYSTAIGRETTAESYGQVSLGIFNTPLAGNATGITATDRLLVVGNGTSAGRSDALVMLKNGNTTLNGALTINHPSSTSSYTLPTAKGTAGQVLSIDNATTGTTTWTNIASVITGLVSVTEGGDTGFRLANSNAANHGDIGTAAVDISFQGIANSTSGATGNISFASGEGTTASGHYSSAFGRSTIASGLYSSAFGRLSTARGDYSIAMTNEALAHGNYSLALGHSTVADSYGQISLGIFNTLLSGTAGSIIPTDRLLVVGNGTNASNRSDALVILKDGSTTLNGALTINSTSTTASYTLPIGGGSNGQVLSMLDATTGTTTWTNVITEITGLVSVTESGNTGYRFANADASRHGDIGDDAVDLSIQEAVVSISEGATGDSSFAGGQDTSATGDYSTAFGFVTHADSYGQTSIGHFNTASPGNLNAVVATDRLFVIGNGANLASTSDALVMLKNGNTTLNGALTINHPSSTSSYTLPITKGTAGQVLSIDNAITGTTTWTNIASAITGLVSVTENGNTGYRLANAPENNHGDIGDDAIDLSIQDALSTTRGATGQYAFATGRRTTASGDYSTVFGRDNTASANHSTAFGYNTTASDNYTTAFGRNTLASNDYSTAFGYTTTASGTYSTAFGRDTEAGGEYSTAFGFETEATGDYSTAFGRGSTASGLYSTAFGESTDATGANSTAFGENSGASGRNSTAIGFGTTASGDYSTAMGESTTASGTYSTAFGRSTTASGDESTAFGRSTMALGDQSTAFGRDTNASGVFSTAFGRNTTANGNVGTAFGYQTTAEAYAQTSLGHYNSAHPGTPNANSITASDRLFVIGNGTSSAARSDALVILKNGTTTLNGALTLNPTGTSSYTLPTARGTAGQVLSIDNATTGTTTWTTLSGGGVPQQLTASALSANNTMTLAISSGNTVTLDFTSIAPSGLLSVTQSGNTGYRLANANTTNHANIGDNAIDLSIQDQASTLRGASGDFAFAAGNRTTASGDYSTVFGHSTTASGAYSTAFGSLTQATADNATAWGDNTDATGYSATAWGDNTDATGYSATAWGGSTTASGAYSTAFGYQTTAESYLQTTIGTYNTTQTGNANSFAAGDRLLVVGNGSNATNRSDAMVILKNGNVGIGDSTPTEGTLVVSGTTILNGALTLDPTGTSSYTLPTHKGTAGQVLSIDNATTGTTTWTTVSGGSGKFVDGTNTANAVFTTGNVGIATTAPTASLHVSGTMIVEGRTRTGSTTLLKYPGAYNGGPGSSSAILGIEGQTDARLRLMAASQESDSGIRTPNIDLYANNATLGGVIDFVAGNTTKFTGNNEHAMRFYTYPSTSTPRQLSMALNSNGTLVLGTATSTIPSDLSTYTLAVGGNALIEGALTLDPTGTSSYTLPTHRGTAGQVLSIDNATTGTTTWTTVAGGASTGLASMTENGNSGYRLALEDADNHGNIGNQAVDLSIQTNASTTRGSTGSYSIAMGRNATAQGINSTAMGYTTTAMGSYSTAMGYITNSSGSYSTAMGRETIASGDYSFAMGRETTASKDYSTAMGFDTTASGDYSTAMGARTQAIGDYATAWGESTTATGTHSSALGRNTTAESYGQTTIGYFNTPHPGTPFTSGIVYGDRLFVVGNGVSSSSRSDAMVILKNGNTTLNGELTLDPTGASSYTLPTHRGTAGQVLSIDNATTGTTTWTNIASAITGLVSVTEGSNTGHRLATESAANHGDIGNESVDLSIQDVASGSRGATGDFSFALGRRTTASGNHSTAFGTENSATADYSTAFGNGTTASGNYSTAFGNNTQASGNHSTAWGVATNALGVNATVWGSSSIASGTLSTAFGGGTTAESFGQTTLGFYNTAHPGTPNATANVGSDRLLVVGNGTGSAIRSDALVILKNGNVGIGDSTPTEGTLVVSGTIVSSGSMTANATLTPDYVFESYFNGASEANPDYNFPSLAEVEAFVKENHHLPNVASAAEVEAQGGIVLNRASEVQLEKIEELYLHTIEQQKQLGAQQEQLEAQQKEIETLKAMVKHLMEKK